MFRSIGSFFATLLLFVSEVLRRVTFTTRRWTRRNGFVEHENDWQLTKRCLIRLSVFVGALVVGVGGLWVFVTHTLPFALLFGKLPAAFAVISWSAVTFVVIVLLSVVGVPFFFVMGFRSNEQTARHRYFATGFVVLLGGLLLALFVLIFDPFKHSPALVAVAMMALTIVAWCAVRNRMLGLPFGTVGTVAIITFGLATLPMGMARIIETQAWGQKVTTHFSPQSSMSPITGEVKWCRPDTSAYEQYEWPERLPKGAPRRFACSDAVGEKDPVTMLPSVPFTPTDALAHLEWEETQGAEREQKSVTLEPVQEKPDLTVTTTSRHVRLRPNSEKILAFDENDFSPLFSARGGKPFRWEVLAGCVQVYANGRLVNDGDQRRCVGEEDIPSLRAMGHLAPDEYLGTLQFVGSSDTLVRVYTE